MFVLSLFYSMGNNEVGLDGEKYVILSEQLIMDIRRWFSYEKIWDGVKVPFILISERVSSRAPYMKISIVAPLLLLGVWKLDKRRFTV